MKNGYYKTGFELQEQYKVPILGHSLFLPCPEICRCGHHISLHKGQGCNCKCTVEGCNCRFGFYPYKSHSMPYGIFKKYVRPFLEYLEEITGKVNECRKDS